MRWFPKAVLCALLLSGTACISQPMKPAQATLCIPCIRGDMSFLASDELQGRGSGTRDEHLAALYAASLFAGLRALEEAHVQIILCRNFDERGLGLAIRDRLLKAAGGKVFRL